MFDLLKATAEDFEPYIGKTFVVMVQGYAVPLILEKVEHLPLRGQPTRPAAPFSLIWRGPAELELTQGVCSLLPPEGCPLPALEGVLMVPIGQNDNGIAYQVVFN